MIFTGKDLTLVSILVFSLSACSSGNDSSGNDSSDGDSNSRTLYECCSRLVSSGTGADFSNIEINTSATATITVTNEGTGQAMDLTISPSGMPYDFLGGSYPGAGGTCGKTLVANESCNIVLEFTPTAAGEYLQDLSLKYYSGDTLETNVILLNQV